MKAINQMAVYAVICVQVHAFVVFVKFEFEPVFCILIYVRFHKTWLPWFLQQLFSDPVIATSEQLAPFSGQDLVGMSCGELCLLSELANIDFTQFKVIAVGRVATEGPNLASGLQSSQISILYSYVKPTHLPYYYHL